MVLQQLKRYCVGIVERKVIVATRTKKAYTGFNASGKSPRAPDTGGSKTKVFDTAMTVFINDKETDVKRVRLSGQEISNLLANAYDVFTTEAESAYVPAHTMIVVRDGQFVRREYTIPTHKLYSALATL